MRNVIRFRWRATFSVMFAWMTLMWVGQVSALEDPDNDRGVKQSAKPNVLLILVDDLKPVLGCYGDKHAKTPNIDALASRGMRFDLAYCNQAVCAPSRFTLMLGAHSTSTGLYGLGNNLRHLVPDAVTMPQYFAKHGYRTESLGKVFHVGHGNQGDPTSFSVEHFKDKVIEYLDDESTDGGKLTREEALFTNQKLGEIKSLPRGAAFEFPVARDTDYADGRVAAETIKRLKAAKSRAEGGTPFFIAAGFVRPHLPFSAPKKYWDLFDPETLPLPANQQFPDGAPDVARKRGGEITAYKPVPPQGEISEELKRQLIHGYYASTSYVDAQIGKVIKALDDLDLDKNTIVVLWGDHGFHLGDLGIWTKHTNYEQANRIPILFVAPGVAKPGTKTMQLAESVDIFPTLAELAGLPIPNPRSVSKNAQPIDGCSLVPVLKYPNSRVRDHAFHAYPKRKLGRAIRTERYRLVSWQNLSKPKENAEFELYDYKEDPNETKNIADSKPEIVKRLNEILSRYPKPVARKKRKPIKRTEKGKGSAKRSIDMSIWDVEGGNPRKGDALVFDALREKVETPNGSGWRQELKIKKSLRVGMTDVYEDFSARVKVELSSGGKTIVTQHHAGKSGTIVKLYISDTRESGFFDSKPNNGVFDVYVRMARENGNGEEKRALGTIKSGDGFDLRVTNDKGDVTVSALGKTFRMRVKDSSESYLKFGNYLQAQDPKTMRKVDDSDDWAEFYRDAGISMSVVTFSNVNHVRR